MVKRFYLSLIFACIMGLVLLTVGCGKKGKPLIVYAGKGLQAGVEDIVHTFEKRYNINVEVVYGGSKTLLSAILKTKKGDIFIPGDIFFVKKAGDLIAHYQIISEHIPVVVVRADNPKQIQSLQDLTRPGTSLAIGNVRTCAIGAVTKSILKKTGNEKAYMKNVIIESASANELLDLVIQKEVDASITFAHLLKLQEAKEVRKIDISAQHRITLQIPIGVLSMSENRKNAELFFDFAVKEGGEILKKHGFGE